MLKLAEKYHVLGLMMLKILMMLYFAVRHSAERRLWRETSRFVPSDVHLHLHVSIHALLLQGRLDSHRILEKDPTIAGSDLLWHFFSNLDMGWLALTCTWYRSPQCRRFETVSTCGFRIREVTCQRIPGPRNLAFPRISTSFRFWTTNAEILASFFSEKPLGCPHTVEPGW